MPDYFDQTGRVITLTRRPERIISLVPSQTELLADLGLGQEVVGITKFCIHPERWYKTKQRVGGTKTLDLAVIRKIQPDLIIANKEENVKEQIDALSKEYPVWISDVTNLDTAYGMIRSVGRLVNKENEAADLITHIQSGFEVLSVSGMPSVRRDIGLKTAYLIWKDPLMTVGGDTFIHSMMEIAGYKNVFENKTRYPETSIDELSMLKPDLLLLSSEPYPFKEKHCQMLRELLPETWPTLVDGQMFSWYGSRMKYAPAYFSSLRSNRK